MRIYYVTFFGRVAKRLPSWIQLELGMLLLLYSHPTSSFFTLSTPFAVRLVTQMLGMALGEII